MAKVKFLPSEVEVDCPPNMKLLAAARRAKVDIRFGCAACQCGTCAVKVGGANNLSPMETDEKNLLQKIGLAVDGSVRLACRARVQDSGQDEQDLEVDISFQDQYSP